MLGLIKSDFYKLFRMKSFYICAVIAALFSAFGIWVFDMASRYQFAQYGWQDLYVSQFTGVYSLTFGMTFATLFIMIVMSMFIPSEFGFGTMKNIVSKGFTRISVYISKYIVMISVSAVYSVLCAVSAFTAGTFIAGVGEFDRVIFLDILSAFGLCLLAQVALQSVFHMVCFLIRNTGWTITTNAVIFMFLPEIMGNLNLAVNYLLNSWATSVSWLSWMKVDGFSLNDYWPLPYIVKFVNTDMLHMDFYRQELITGVIVCVVYIVLTGAIGIMNFRRRDID